MTAAVLTALVLAGLLAVPGASAGAATRAGQVVTVSAASSTSTFATVEAWARQPDGRYRRVAHFRFARVGAAGIGSASEGSTRTPAGVHRLSTSFGAKPDPGTRMPWFRIGRDDVWTGSDGTVVNQHRRCAPGTCPPRYGGFERLSSYTRAYAYATFIGYNAPPPHGTGAVRGKGSAFFLHVKNASATAGCVAVSERQMVWLLRWLDPAANPVISIGVGARAYAPIPDRYV